MNCFEMIISLLLAVSSSVEGSPEVDPVTVVVKAAIFATIKHRNQTRLDQARTPFIIHPIGVAFILTDLCGITDPDVIAAGLLHDTVEDTDTTFEELEREFGKVITDIVRECSDNLSLAYEERKRLQIANAPSASPKAKLVKLADKLNNLRDLVRDTPRGWSDEKVSKYWTWSEQVVAGLRGSNENVENALDLLFKTHNSPAVDLNPS